MARAIRLMCVAVLTLPLLSGPLFQAFCAESTGLKDPSPPKSAEADARNVIVKIGRHQGFVRFVFMSSEGNVYSATAKQAGKDTIAVEFPPALAYHLAERGPLAVGSVTDAARDVRLAVKRSGCVLTVESLSDFKVSKLSSPPRLVIDAVNSPQAVPPPVQDRPQVPAAQSEPAARLVTLMIDAGHGGYDKGIQGEGFSEKDLALSLSKDLGNALAKKGKKVFVTRKADQVLTIRERIRLVGQRSPDLLLSIHVSSDGKLRVYGSPPKPPGGVEDAQRADAYAKAHSVSQSFAESLVQAFRGETDVQAETDSLPISLVTQVKVPALVIEMPNPDKFSYEGKARERLLAAIVRGLTTSQ